MKKWVFWFSLSKTRNFFLLNKYFWTSTYLLGYKIKSSDLFEIWRSYINCLSVIRAVSVKKAVFCDVKLCKLIDKYWYFRAICGLHLQLQMGEADCTATSVLTYQTTRHQIPEYRKLPTSLVVISIYCTSQLCPLTDEICFLFQTVYCTLSIYVHKF